MASVSLSPPSRFPRRYLSLALPHLPTDRVFRQRSGRSWRSAAPREAGPPLAVVAKVKSALRLIAFDSTAERLGLTRGMALADARAMIPALDAVDEDPAGDTLLLERIADWAERYTPLVALDPPHGLMLDIAGCAHLFGGEAALVDDLTARLRAQGFDARAAIADSPGAASAAARHTAIAVVSPGEAAVMLEPLPLAALRLDPATVFAMERTGLKRVGQIMGAPRAPLAARFGGMLIRRLDQALGLAEEAISPRRPLPALIAERRFAEPIVSEDDISTTLASLAATLSHTLEERNQGARAFELALFRVDGAVSHTLVRTSRPIRAPKLVTELFREKFAGLAEEIDAGFGFDMVRLAIPAVAAADAVQIDLAGDATGEADLGQLIDRIGARLGADHVHRLVPNDSHIPEEASRLIEIGKDGPPALDRQPATLPFDADANASLDPIDRPLRLFARPEPVDAVAEVPDGPPAHFRWRRAIYRIVRAEGPERIAPEWWRDGTDEFTRDYFRVEDASGHRFWLYREGIYGRETTTARWYLHGVFA